MALKPMKLKRYVTEEDAAELLSSLIGEKVTANEMEDYARQGIVPAYMQARSTFFLFDLDVRRQFFQQPVEADNNHEPYFSEGLNGALGALNLDYKLSEAQARHSVSIIPWPQDDIVEDTDGVEWFLRAEGESYGATAAITDEHYSRVYVPSEICKAAALMNDPAACPEWPAVPHSQGHTFSREGGKDTRVLSYFARPDIPDIVQSTLLSEKAPHVEPTKPSKLDAREAESYRLMIYALARESGYPLDQPAKAEKALKIYLSSIGISKLVGSNGTIQKHFKAARVEGERAIKAAAESAN